jgi:hypothetical protein
MLVARKDAAVYADGFYAGTVDDFDGRLGALPLPPGGHGIVLHLEGYRTVRRNIYLRAASTFELHEVLERLPPGVMSEPPPISPRLPPPPAGTFTAPRTPTPPYPSEVVVLELLDAVPFGRLDLLVHPPTAEVTVDGDRWDSSDAGHLALQLRAGVHRVEVRQSGYRTFTTDLDILESTTVPLKISLRAHTLP